jgi:hypothetical protein
MSFVGNKSNFFAQEYSKTADAVISKILVNNLFIMTEIVLIFKNQG